MYDRILIVVDDDAMSDVAVAEGMSLARIHDAELVFFTALPSFVMPVTEMSIANLPAPEEFEHTARLEAERRLNAAVAMADAAGLRSQPAVGRGLDDAECIAQAAVDLHCALIVVATTGRNAVMRLLTGSVIPGLITRSTLPVLVCRQASPRVAVKSPAASGLPARNP